MHSPTGASILVFIWTLDNYNYKLINREIKKSDICISVDMHLIIVNGLFYLRRCLILNKVFQRKSTFIFIQAQFFYLIVPGFDWMKAF